MEKPKLSWIPIRLISDIMKGRKTLEDWLNDAKNKFNLSYVEMYFGFLHNFEKKYVGYVAKKLQEYGLKVSQLCTTTDFTHPDREERRKQHDYLKKAIIAASEMGAPAIRFVPGQHHPGVSDDKGIEWVVSGLEEMIKFSEPYDVQIRLENHYRDRAVWDLPDFAFKSEVFFKLFENIKNTPVMINFDCSNALVSNESPVEILKVVKDKVASIHASDRKYGTYEHSIIGQGDAPFDEIFMILKQSGFAGAISAEDGNVEGDEGFRKGLGFLRKKIDEYWK